MTPIRVLIADDYALCRQGLASLLAAEGDFEVVGEAVDGLQAVEMAREVKPDVIVMDVSMPVMDGLEATRRIKAETPDAKIVIVTESDGESRLLEALRCGAEGYIPQKSEPRALYGTLRQLVQGEAAVTPVIAARLLEAFAELTAPQRGVLGQVARGSTGAEIAATMGIPETAVKNHLKDALAQWRSLGASR